MQDVKITIQETTNDTIIKFNINQVLINGGSYEYNNIDEAKNAPLVQQLFHLPFVKKVFITANFIAIQRFDIIAWKDVQEEVKEQIENYLNDNGVVVNESQNTNKEAIEVYAEVTPNPSVMKFGSNKSLTKTDVEYKNIEEASKSSPLAFAIFNFSFVKEVFISDNYISVTKYDMVEWGDVYPELRSFIREYLADGKTIIKELPTQETSPEAIIEIPKVALEGISAQIVDILDEYIKPAVAGDGGNIQFLSYVAETKEVNVLLQGACNGCPSSTITLKNGIEATLKQLLPGKIGAVNAMN